MKKNKKDTSNYYFTEDTDNAIIKYNLSTDPKARAEIFEKEIYQAFYKLAENIIHTFKFYYTDVADVEDLKHTIVAVLLEEKISKFNPTIGAKAYSYFGTIVKRWLINYNNSNYKELKRLVNIDLLEIDPIESEDYVELNSVSLSEFFDFYITTMYSQLDTLFFREQDKLIADAVLTIFKTRRDIQILKKKALYLYIKEMVNCKTSDLTEVVKVLKRKFYELYEQHINKGLVNNL